MVSRAVRLLSCGMLWITVVCMSGCFNTKCSHNHCSFSSNRAVNAAIAHVIPTVGNNVSGYVEFIRRGKKTLVKGVIKNLTPGKHGFHIHEYGDLSNSDGTASGDHFNPTGHKHGNKNSRVRHVGDLGNLVADQNGVANFSFLDSKITLSGKNSIVGRAVIIHEKEDDLVTQPTGGAGARVCHGVIGIKNTKQKEE